MHNNLLLALISLVRLLGLIVILPVRAACVALCEEAPLQECWAGLVYENPWLRSMLSSRTLCVFVPVFARIPREHVGWHPPRVTNRDTFFHPRLK